MRAKSRRNNAKRCLLRPVHQSTALCPEARMRPHLGANAHMWFYFGVL
jgi:hypothetical protein